VFSCISRRPMFQFLSRNSVRWDSSSPMTHAVGAICFNSSVGILSVGTESTATATGSLTDVSIPQSEFCPLGLGISRERVSSLVVSIPQSEFCPLGPWARDRPRSTGMSFQFLSRNSVRWDHLMICNCLAVIYSFNSSVGILSVGTIFHHTFNVQILNVSIPQSEFCPLGPCEGCQNTIAAHKSFNSSVGILSVGT